MALVVGSIDIDIDFRYQECGVNGLLVNDQSEISHYLPMDQSSSAGIVGFQDGHITAASYTLQKLNSVLY